MTIANIISNQQDFLSYVKDQAMPNGNLSIRGTARCCGVHHTALIRGGDFKSEKLGQTLTSHGFQAGDLESEGFPPQAVWLSIEFYAFESKAKAPMAKQLARTFGSIGIITTLEKLTQKPTEVEERRLPPVRDYIDHLDATERIKNIDNPILRSLLEQAQMEHLSNGKVLKSSEPELVLAAVVARDLGYNLKSGEDGLLGKWVKKHHEPKGQAQHGRYKCNVYENTPELIETIHAFFR